MKNFKTKMLCRLLSLVMLISLINIPTTFAENALVMQVGTNGTAIVDKVSKATSIRTHNKYDNNGGELLQGKLENANQTTYIEMNKDGAVGIDIDNDFLNNIEDATFEMWFDNNYASTEGEYQRYNRHLFSLYDEANGKEVFAINVNNGASRDSRGYGFYAEVNGVRSYNEKTSKHTMFDEWVHFAVTFNLEENGKYTKFIVYRNGVRAFDNIIENIANVDGTYTSAISSSDIRIRLGHTLLANTGGDRDYGFVGRLGDMKVYNYAKTAADVASSYNADKALYINDLSTNFAIEKHDGKYDNTIVGPRGTDKVEACAVTAQNGYVFNPYALGGAVKVTFTSPINKNSVTENSINLVDESGNVVPGSTSVEISDMGYVAYITYGQLTDGAKYAVKLNGLQSVSGQVLTATSAYFTFTGGTAENGILLVRPFNNTSDGTTKIEFTLNHSLASFNPELCLEGTSFELQDAAYDAATRTITLETYSTNKLIAGRTYTVGYAGMTKEFKAVDAGKIVIEVPTAPEAGQPDIPAAPAEPEGSLLMNISVVDGEIVDTTGKGTVTPYLLNQYSVSGKIQKGYLANKKQTPYIEFTGQGAGMLEVDSSALEGQEKMTFDVWVKNDDRNTYSSQSNVNTYKHNNTLFAIADPDAEGEPWYFHMGLNDGVTYDQTALGYGIFGASKPNPSEKVNASARTSSVNSNLWDEWTHIVVTKEKPATGTNYTIKYYINGEKVVTSYAGYQYNDETGETVDGLLWNDTVLRIGHIDANGAYQKWRGFKGKISEFKAFNYVKTEEDIKTQYEAQKYNYIEDLSDKFTLELVEASKQENAAYPYEPYAAGGKIKATFSAPVMESTINEKTLNLVDASGNVIPGSVSVEMSDQGTVAYISYGEVAVGSEYYLKVDGLQSVNGVTLEEYTSEPIVFIDGGEAEEGILLVRPFDVKSIEITLNYPLTASEFDATKAVLSAGGREYTNTTATYDEATRTITITGKDNFVQRGIYTFTYDGKSKTFIAEHADEPISIGTPIFRDQSGNEITTDTITGVEAITSDIDVITDGSKEFVAILSVYHNGALVGMDMLGTNNSGSVNKFTNEVTELNSTYTYTFNLEVSDLDDTEAYTSKVMLWNTMNNLTPYEMYVPSDN